MIWEQDMIDKLEDKTVDLHEYVIMERIHNPPFPSLVFNPEKNALLVRDAIGELGIFGAYVSLGKRILMNNGFGHLLRSKAQTTKQGGVFLGHAVVDSPMLY